MELQKKKLPLGVKDFGELRKGDYYYVDRTGMIKELLYHLAAVTLFTRPAKFGKSLNLSMLEHFLSLEGDKHIFDGLEISRETELCEKHMGKYPVISLSFREITGDNYDTALRNLSDLIVKTAKKYQFLLDSERLNEFDKENYRELLNNSFDTVTLGFSLKDLTELLEKHYGKKVIVLIDDYDAPLACAYAKEYYLRMSSLIYNMLGTALKTNFSLEFAVMTGYLNPKYTGLNHVLRNTMTDWMYDQCFGFTDEEVQGILAYYDLAEHRGEFKKWYEGYQFGRSKVSSPLDIINQCDVLLKDPTAAPKSHWIDSSENIPLKCMIEKAGRYYSVKEDVERLMAGESIKKRIDEYITYPEIFHGMDTLWSLLYLTGYVTSSRKEDTYGYRTLSIPNREVREAFVEQSRIVNGIAPAASPQGASNSKGPRPAAKM